MSGLEEFELEREATRLTKVAYEDAAPVFGRTIVGPLIPCEASDGTLIYVYVKGQSSVTGHGKQGMKPELVAGLRRMDRQRPVRLAFCEGRGKWACAWLRVLDAQGPADVISHGDPADIRTRRYGWAKGRLENGGKNEPLTLPPSGPPEIESGRLEGF